MLYQYKLHSYFDLPTIKNIEAQLIVLILPTTERQLFSLLHRCNPPPVPSLARESMECNNCVLDFVILGVVDSTKTSVSVSSVIRY